MIDGVACIGCELVDFDIVSTPLLHYLVASRNDPSVGESSREGYIKRLVKGLRTIRSKVGALWSCEINSGMAMFFCI